MTCTWFSDVTDYLSENPILSSVAILVIAIVFLFIIIYTLFSKKTSRMEVSSYEFTKVKQILGNYRNDGSLVKEYLMIFEKVDQPKINISYPFSTPILFARINDMLVVNDQNRLPDDCYDFIKFIILNKRITKDKIFHKFVKLYIIKLILRTHENFDFELYEKTMFEHFNVYTEDRKKSFSGSDILNELDNLSKLERAEIYKAMGVR